MKFKKILTRDVTSIKSAGQQGTKASMHPGFEQWKIGTGITSLVRM
jgi:hypothetical protein